LRSPCGRTSRGRWRSRRRPDDCQLSRHASPRRRQEPRSRLNCFFFTAPSSRYLGIVHCGDPAEENEATQLDNYFLVTEQFRLSLNGELNIILGRKGSGKSAIFIQTRDKLRSDRDNIVVDLAPKGFQLIKLKEFILEQLSLGTRKEFIAAFWEYIVWLEIAYKLLEKDERRTRIDSRLIQPYNRLKAAYSQRVEGSGDFAVRLSDLTARILGRYEAALKATPSETAVSAKTLEIVYGWRASKS
jgi:hypothetical protein